MKKYLEKKARKYVIASLGNPTLYLKKTAGKSEYSFVEDIEIATKALKESVMNQVLRYYYLDTGLDTELVVVPIEITYEIIDDEYNE
jgi:hypothetical protein